MSSRLQEWKILYMLWWALSGHNLQHNNATEDVVLYGTFITRFLRRLQTNYPLGLFFVAVHHFNATFYHEQLSPIIHLPLTFNFSFNSIQFHTNWMPIDLFVGEPNSILFYHANSIPIDLVVGEPNHPLHGHLLPHSAHLLLAVGQRGEGGQHQHHQHLRHHHDHHQHVHNRPKKLLFFFFCTISCLYYLYV